MQKIPDNFTYQPTLLARASSFIDSSAQTLGSLINGATYFVSHGFSWAKLQLYTLSSQVKETVTGGDDPDSTWNHYVHSRFVPHGLPISIAVSSLAARLFGCATFQSGAIFGAVNYGVFTTLTEVSNPIYGSDTNERRIKMVITGGLSYFITKAFMQTVCKTTLDHRTTFILSIASLSGQVFRQILGNRKENSLDL